MPSDSEQQNPFVRAQKFEVRPQVAKRALYASFDVVPSAKGAARHIEHMAETLFSFAGGGTLFCLGEPGLPAYQRDRDREIVRFSHATPNLFERALLFGDALAGVVQSMTPQLEWVHFRDPFSGLPLLDEGPPSARYVYEVNGFPSVELPNRYPSMTHATIKRLHAWEQRCLTMSDLIVTPAKTIARAVVRRGISYDKIRVIRNGATPPCAARVRPENAPARYFIYFGALQPWQGVELAMRAFSKVAAVEPVDLVICASTREKSSRHLQRLARRLQVETRVHFLHRLSPPDLSDWLGHAEASLVPLTECARNLEQGCCPMKLLESLAAGTPVIASDLPAVRELVEPETHAVLLPAERPERWSRAMLEHLADGTHAKVRAGRGQQHVLANFTWSQTKDALRSAYAELAHKKNKRAHKRD